MKSRQDYSALFQIYKPDQHVWVSGTGKELARVDGYGGPGSVACMITLSSTNAVYSMRNWIEKTTKIRVMKVISNSVVVKDIVVPGITLPYSTFDLSYQRNHPDPAPVFSFLDGTLFCYTISDPDVFPKPSITLPQLNGGNATVEVTTPSENAVFVESSTNLLGWSLVKRLDVSPNPSKVTVPTANLPQQFLRAREE